MDSKGSALRLAVFSIFCATSLFAGGDELLSSLKKESFEIRDDKARAERFLGVYDWLLKGSVSYSDKKNISPEYRTKSFLVSVDQPIFKSGGILNQSWYADAAYEATRLGVAHDRNEAIREVLELALKIKKTVYSLKKEELGFENAKIDVERKRAHYLAGLLDGSYLDNAISSKNSAENSFAARELELKQLKNRFEALSDKDPMSVEMPSFELVGQEQYLEKNIELAKAKAEAKSLKYKKRVTVSEYLPQVSLFANYADTKQTSPNTTYESSLSSYSYGFKISMALDFKSYKSYEKARLEQILAENSAAQKMRDAKNEYKDVLSKIETIDKKISIAKSDAKVYESLYEQTLSLYKAGLKTDDDVAVMQNSKNAKELEIKSLTIDRQIEIMALYMKASS